MGMVALLLLTLWSCQRETILDDGAAGLQGSATNTGCGVSAQAGLVDATGNPYVNICPGGPCTTTTPWGFVTYSKATNSLGSQAFLNVEVALSPGIYAEFYTYEVGGTGNFTANNGVPVFGPNGSTTYLNPVRNQFTFQVPLPSNLSGEACIEFALEVGIVRTDILGAVVGRRSLYASNAAVAGEPYLISECYNACTLAQTTTTQGVCQGCRSAVTVTFSGCASVDVSACKPIRQVVIVYDDCSREYHDNLTATNYFFPTSGLPISHVYVRSGCRAGNNNTPADDLIDTNGYTYNNVARFRFDGPCLNGACQ